MNFFYLRFFIAGLLFSLISFFAVAQRSNGLAIEGKISVQQGLVEGAYIQMFMDGRRMENYGVGADGRYKVELTYNHKYELIFTLEKNFSQKIVVESTVPKDILQTDPKFPPFPLNINLFTEIPGIDKSFVNNTILKIYYSRSVDNFISELYYNDAQIAKLIEQAVLQSKMVGKESDYLSKLSKAELAEMKKEYNSLIEQAGKEYSKEEFLAALDGFKAASKIFPNEQFPKDRIAEINDLLGLIMVAAELDKALAERFTVLIKEADLFFNQKNYSDARNSYNRALSIKPTDSYANQQISVINGLLKNQQNQEQYDGLIAKADNSFNQLLYNEAAKTYQEALTIKPNEAYPKTKIQEINGILAEESKNAEKQESYKQAMQQGEIMFQKQFYEKSLASYENALSLKPGDQLATKKVEDVKAVMKSLADKLMYDKLILSADKSFKKELYNEALADYTAAAVILPDDKYAARRIEEINEKLKLEGNFAELIKNADDSFAAKKYDESKSFYSDALKIKANDKYSLDRIKEIDGILAARGVDEKYNAAVSEADRLLTEKKYEDARGKYTEASAVKPKETYPKTKIAEIGTILQQLAKTDQDYQKTIAKGDGLMQQKQYDQAILSFSEAGKLKPEEKYPAEMIAKANVLIEEQKQLAAKNEAERIRLEKEKADAEAARLAAIQAEKDKNYADAIAKADNLFNEKNYEAARTEYRAALTVKSNETYPQQKVTEIGTLLAQLSAAQKAYETAIAKADKELKAEKFDAAKLAYSEAQKAKPEESYPAEQIAKIDSTVETRAKLAADAAAEKIRLEKEKADAEAARLAAIQAEKDKNYADAIAKADNLFNEKNYEAARTEYRNALTSKPNETYPQQKVTEIGTLLAQLSAAQKAYETAIAKADKELKAEKFDAAKLAYSEAQKAKPEESYPTEQIAKIDSTVETRAKLAADAAAEKIRLEKEKADAEAARLAAIQAEKDKNYSEAITKADNLFNEKNYEAARTEYRAALTAKPGETYPQQKVTEIGTLLAQLSAAQKAYETAIAKADKEFKAEKFDAAKLAYSEAQKAKPDESYPTEQIAKIDSTVETRAKLAADAAAEKIRLEKEKADAEAARLAAIQAEKDKNYSEAITKADNFFNEKNYEAARTEYRNALAAKPNETYPQQKVTEIGTLLAQLSAAQKAYETAIAKADKEFKAEKFDAAKLAYNEAKTAKPDESYPAEQIAKIDSTVETRAKLAADAAAEKIRLEKEKADAEAARLAAIQAEKDKNYADAIAKADNLFNEKNYESARTEYRAALTAKPNEAYPQQKVTEIGTLLAQLSAAQKAYETAIANADKEFKAEKFDAAKLAYSEAQKAKPEESYPTEQIAKIDSTVETRAKLAADAAAEKIRLEKEKADAEAARLAAVQAEKDKNYSEAITKADNFFNEKNYEAARTEYRNALAAKPNETYPQQKVTEIGTLLAQLSAAQKAYETAIAKADKEFKAEKFDAAKLAYNEAKTAKPDESYPAEQIAKIDSTVETRAKLAADAAAEKIRLEKEKADAEAARLAAIQAEKDKNYADAIAKADNLFNEKNYESARTEYRAALTAKPNEAYPQQKVTEIGTLLAQLSAAQKAYETAIANADKELKAERFDAAKLAYNEAKTAKPEENYPAEQIAKIDSTVETRAKLAADAAAEKIRLEKEKADAEAARLAAIQAEKDKNYSEAITKADNFFNEKNYEAARTEYRNALAAKPNETYPQQKIDEIGKTLAAAETERKEKELLDKNYTTIIQQADRFFASKTYDQSKSKFQEAQKLKPAETYPAEKIAEIEKILAQQAVDEQYRVIILAADGFFKTEKYLQAKTEYEKALTVKSEEQYPKNQIAKIDDILQKEKQKILSEKNAAEDLQRRSAEIAKLNEEIEARGMASESELNSLYDQYISQGDAFFDSRDYIVSRGWYYRALSVKNLEKYPKQRIDEINRLLGSLLNSQLDRDYQKFVDLADSTFRENQYAVARGWYNRALGVKANEKYPKDQLKEIEAKIAERMAGQSGQQFDTNMQKAAAAFEAKNYSVARFWYKKALELRPDNADAKNRLKEIDEAMKK